MRELLHCAYWEWEEAFVGCIAFDASDPRAPVEVGRFDCADRTPYSEAGVGEEGFGNAHHADADPQRDLVLLIDERRFGKPGGKHVLDVGWKDGSLEKPVPIGYTLSPNAQRIRSDADDDTTEFTELLDWTGHDGDMIPWGDETLYVSGDWHEGVVLYDLTDPTDPRPIDQYATADGASAVRPNDTVARYGDPPMSWAATYNDTRDFVVAADSFTGVYTFELAVDGDESGTATTTTASDGESAS